MQVVAKSGESIDMEACFSQLTLDVIGKAVFNYDFNALNTDSPLIQVPLKLEHSMVCVCCWLFLPYWARLEGLQQCWFAQLGAGYAEPGTTLAAGN